MKMYSNEKPAALHQSGGVWFFNLNPVLIPGHNGSLLAVENIIKIQFSVINIGPPVSFPVFPVNHPFPAAQFIKNKINLNGIVVTQKITGGNIVKL